MKSKNLTVMLIEICTSVTGTKHQMPSPHPRNLTTVQDLVLSVVDKYEGTVVKELSGALLVVFESPTVSIKAGMEIQRRNRSEAEPVFSEGRIEVRIAINSGEIALSHDDAFGEAVTFLQNLQKIIDPGQVVFTEATRLSMNRSHIPDAEVGYYQVASNANRIKVYKIREDANRAARIANRSLSFFGLLRNDPEDRPYKVFPAPTGRRLIAGVLEIWIGAALMLGVSILCKLPQIWAFWSDVIRIQAEDFSTDGAPVSKWNEPYGRFIGTGVVMTANDRVKTQFSGPSGRYYIVSAYGYRASRGAASSAAVVVGEQKFPYYKAFKGRFQSQIEQLGGPVKIENGEIIRIDGFKVDIPDEYKEPDDAGMLQNFQLIVDYVEFIPENSFAYRPRGWELGFRYIDFYRAINYDDMNLHFFLGPLPVWIFFHLFVSQLLFSRTLGGIIMGLHIRTEKTNEKIRPWAAFLRTACWFLVPFWAWTAIGRDHMWTDTVSHSRVVVFRE